MKSLKATGARLKSVCVWTYLALKREIGDIGRGNEGKDARYPRKPRCFLAKLREKYRKLLPYMVQKMAGTESHRAQASN